MIQIEKLKLEVSHQEQKELDYYWFNSKILPYSEYIKHGGEFTNKYGKPISLNGYFKKAIQLYNENWNLIYEASNLFNKPNGVLQSEIYHKLGKFHTKMTIRCNERNHSVLSDIKIEHNEKLLPKLGSINFGECSFKIFLPKN